MMRLHRLIDSYALPVYRFFASLLTMIILLLLCLPLIFCGYALSLEEREKQFFSFFVGILISTLFFLLKSFFFSDSAPAADTLSGYVIALLFAHTLVPVLLGALAGAAVSGFDFLTVPAALFGVFTVKIYHFMFLTSASTRISSIIMYLIVYTGALFIFDALLYFCREITFYYYAAAATAFIVFFAILTLGFWGIGLHHFRRNPISYLIIFGSISTISLCLHFFVHNGKNSA